MLDQLVFYESRAAAADPHRDMRLDIDNMSYEVNTTFCFFILHAPEISSVLLTLPFIVHRTCWLWENLWVMSTQVWLMKKYRSVWKKWSVAVLIKCKMIRMTKMTGAAQFAWYVLPIPLNWCLYITMACQILTGGSILAGELQRQGCAGNTEMQPRLPFWLHQEVATDKEFMPGLQSSRGLGYQRSTNCAPWSIHFRLRSYYVILFFPSSHVNKCSKVMNQLFHGLQ